MSIGENIKRMRETRGLTQAELGLLVGTSAACIRQYEIGFRNPKADKIEKIASALQVSPEVFSDCPPTNEIAMQQIFNIFRNFGGNFDEKGNLSFDQLDLTAFFRQYEIYQKEVEAANQIKDPRQKIYALEDALDKFNYWMDIYPQCLSTEDGYNFEEDFDKIHENKVARRK